MQRARPSVAERERCSAARPSTSERTPEKNASAPRCRGGRRGRRERRGAPPPAATARGADEETLAPGDHLVAPPRLCDLRARTRWASRSSLGVLATRHFEQADRAVPSPPHTQEPAPR